MESSDSPDAKEGEGDTTEQPCEESASAVLSKLTKFIYNCQTSEQSRLVVTTVTLLWVRI